MKASFEKNAFAAQSVQAKISEVNWVSCFLDLIYSIKHMTVCLCLSLTLSTISLEYVCISEDQFSMAGAVSVYHDSIKTNENSVGMCFPLHLSQIKPKCLIPLATSSCSMPLRHSSVLRRTGNALHTSQARPTFHHTGTVKCAPGCTMRSLDSMCSVSTKAEKKELEHVFGFFPHSNWSLILLSCKI